MCPINDLPTDWDDVLERGVKNWKGKDLKIVMARLCLSASVYAIWKETNNIRYGAHLLLEEKILQKII